MPDGFRTPYDSDYVTAIGRALYIFAIYEWNVVWTIEKLHPGFLDEWRFREKRMMAGAIGRKFIKVVSESAEVFRALGSGFEEAAKAFHGFVDERNELVHAHVYSEPNGTQQLIYQRKSKNRTWSIAEIDALSHRLEESSSVLRCLMKEVWNF
jgi:hypothetical protein